MYMSEINAKILFVDDEEDIREIIGEELVDEGYQVTLAVSGNDALEKLNNDQFNAVISDTNMPDGDGEFLLQEFLKLEAHKSTKFYFATGKIEFTEEIVKGKGANGLLPKPFDMDFVLNRLKKEL